MNEAVKVNAQGDVRPARFAADIEEANARFADWHDADPFPKIGSALLNAADIADYVAATAMIHPFDPLRLKAASYPLPLGGKVVWWDKDTRKRQLIDVKEGTEFVLQPNSIAFVTLSPLLQVPDYLALRFNLKIVNVYRGLLLGTGPLIDPGFVGRLSFPLHNLTTNEYRFRGGDDMIWVEVTKLSPSDNWLHDDRADAPARTARYQKSHRHETRRDVEDYVDEAIRHGHVWSSISESLRQAKKAADRARVYSVAGIIALIGIGLSVMSLAYAVLSNQRSVPHKEDVQRNQKAIVALQTEVLTLRLRLKKLEQQGKAGAGPDRSK
jgi:deoxycytidine triphosphate deaminase